MGDMRRRRLARVDRPTGVRPRSGLDRLDDLRARRRRQRAPRPSPPRDARWVLRIVGRILISIGILMFGFVAYQLWGTGIEYARAQDDLEVELASVLPRAAAANGATELPVPTPVQRSEALMRLELPVIGLDATVIEGVGREELEQGPGHYPRTALPGQLGNAAIAGHRTTFGAPFQQLDELEVGDEIITTTAGGRYVYRTTATQIVDPSADEVLATTDPTVARLTLTTCHPEYSAESRLIVFAELDTIASPPPESVVPLAERQLSTTTSGASGDGSTADAFVQGWFSDRGAFAQLALWGSMLTLVSVGARAISRATGRNVVGALIGIGPFVVAAYFFFQNLNRLLPAAL